MNYQKIYDQLIEKRKIHTLSKKICYCEKHHILPLSFNGTNDDENIVYLTAREHFIAHLLLVQISKHQYGIHSLEYEKMLRAVTYFKTCSAKSATTLQNRKCLNFNSRLYQHIRHEFSRMLSETTGERVKGENNGMYGRHHSNDTKKKISSTRKKRKCGVGQNNAMYGRPCYYKMSEDEKLKWKTNIKTTCQNAKFKHMYNPKTLENVLVPSIHTQEYLDNGYVFGQYNKCRRSTKGMKKVCLPIKNAKQIWIRPEQLKNYLDNGYVLWKDRIK